MNNQNPVTTEDVAIFLNFFSHLKPKSAQVVLACDRSYLLGTTGVEHRKNFNVYPEKAP